MRSGQEPRHGALGHFRTEGPNDDALKKAALLPKRPRGCLRLLIAATGGVVWHIAIANSPVTRAIPLQELELTHARRSSPFYFAKRSHRAGSGLSPPIRRRWPSSIILALSSLPSCSPT